MQQLESNLIQLTDEVLRMAKVLKDHEERIQELEEFKAKALSNPMIAGMLDD